MTRPHVRELRAPPLSADTQEEISSAGVRTKAGRGANHEYRLPQADGADSEVCKDQMVVRHQSHGAQVVVTVVSVVVVVVNGIKEDCLL